MDHDEAMGLLRGGAERIKEWNRRRGEGEVIPDLRRADLSGAALRGADLRGADLREADLREAVLTGAVLSGAVLSGAALSGAALSGADLRGAALSRAVLRGADLRGADLREADLREAVLRGTALRGAHLSEAHLRGAVLTGAALRGAALGGADLREAVLRGADLTVADLSGAALSRADLREAVLRGAHLGGADLREADLRGAALREAHLSGAHLGGAALREAVLRGADLRGADLGGADLSEADFRGAHLSGADLREARCDKTSFSDVDLSAAKGLDSVIHGGPSFISTSTLIRSRGRIPEAFLRGCGLPENWIQYLPSLIHGMQPIQFYSCFISYSTKDEDFARRLHSRMRDEGLRVWYSPEDIQGGRKLHEQIDQAIRVYDKLLLVLSPHSMGSEWVRTELRKALKIERREGVRKLFPIRLMDFEAIREWECFDADMGKDLGVELREYFIPDFTAWEEHRAFETSFARLLKDLKAEDSAPDGTAKRTS